MTYFIFARDGTSRIVLKRESRDAAEKKARELTDLGWFEVRVEQDVQLENAEPPKEVVSQAGRFSRPKGICVAAVEADSDAKHNHR
jgi:hypothetical protein